MNLHYMYVYSTHVHIFIHHTSHACTTLWQNLPTPSMSCLHVSVLALSGKQLVCADVAKNTLVEDRKNICVDPRGTVI